ncbi:OmpA family protein [Chitinophagaceae bacterium LWZ2-11]
MKRLILLCIIWGWVYTGRTQTYQPDKVSSKAIDLYDKAITKLRDGYVKDAIPLLTKCIATDPNYVDAYLSLGGAYGEQKNYAKSIELYEAGRAKDTVYFKPYQLPYSINLAGAGRFSDALQAINNFLAIPNLSERSIKSGNYRKNTYQFAIDWQRTHTGDEYVFSPMNLGDSVNSPESEYYPSLTVDDSLLVFTRRAFNNTGEYFYETHLKGKEFSLAQPIGGDLNREAFKGAICVSSDGEWLIFAGNLGSQTYGDYDLYICYNTPEGWSKPENMGENINSGYWDSSPSLSPDNRVLYFSSNRPAGYGGKDLYMSVRKPNGRWSPAVNMGPTINTAGDELAPYIHADNQTLYFTSDGLPGYGGTDLFIMRKKIDGTWGVPENLGYPINTIENEGSIAVSADGLTAYYASDRSDSRGGLDLYRFTLRNDIRPYKTLYVKGRVFDKKTGNGLPSSVQLIDNSNATALMNVQTDEMGYYFITLPTGRNYTFVVNRKGYLYYSESYQLNNQLADSTYKKDIPLQPVEVNATFTLKNIVFEYKSFKLTDDAKVELQQILKILGENPSLKAQLNGYTDNIGVESENIVLSYNRAKAIGDYLISKGIDAKRLQYKGFGSGNPVADNKTEEGRAKNRRTEFVITGL